MKTRSIFTLLFAAACLSLHVGCGRPTEPTVIEQPSEDFLEEIRQGQAAYAADMAATAK